MLYEWRSSINVIYIFLDDNATYCTFKLYSFGNQMDNYGNNNNNIMIWIVLVLTPLKRCQPLYHPNTQNGGADYFPGAST